MIAAWGEAGRFVGPVLRVEVRGTPRPQPRPRSVPVGKGRVRVVSTLRDSPAARWARLVSAEAAAAVRATDWTEVGRGVPVGLRMLIVFGTKDSARWGRLRTAVRNADFDNLAKLLADVLVKQRVMDDDGQIAATGQLHVWGPEAQAGVSIEVGAVGGGVLDGLLAAWGVEGAASGEGAKKARKRASGRARGERGSVGGVGAVGDGSAAGSDTGGISAPGWLE